MAPRKLYGTIITAKTGLWCFLYHIKLLHNHTLLVHWETFVNLNASICSSNTTTRGASHKFAPPFFCDHRVRVGFTTNSTLGLGVAPWLMHWQRPTWSPSFISFFHLDNSMFWHVILKLSQVRFQHILKRPVHWYRDSSRSSRSLSRRGSSPGWLRLHKWFYLLCFQITYALLNVSDTWFCLS